MVNLKIFVTTFYIVFCIIINKIETNEPISNSMRLERDTSDIKVCLDKKGPKNKSKTRTTTSKTSVDRDDKALKSIQNSGNDKKSRYNILNNESFWRIPDNNEVNVPDQENSVLYYSSTQTSLVSNKEITELNAIIEHTMTPTAKSSSCKKAGKLIEAIKNRANVRKAKNEQLTTISINIAKFENQNGKTTQMTEDIELKARVSLDSPNDMSTKALTQTTDTSNSITSTTESESLLKAEESESESNAQQSTAESRGVKSIDVIWKADVIVDHLNHSTNIDEKESGFNSSESILKAAQSQTSYITTESKTESTKQFMNRENTTKSEKNNSKESVQLNEKCEDINFNKAVNNLKIEAKSDESIIFANNKSDGENIMISTIESLDKNKKMINEKDFITTKDGIKSNLQINNMTSILKKSSAKKSNNTNDNQNEDPEDNKLKSEQFPDENSSPTTQFLSKSTKNIKSITTQKISDLRPKVGTTKSIDIESSESKVISNSNSITIGSTVKPDHKDNNKKGKIRLKATTKSAVSTKPDEKSAEDQKEDIQKIEASPESMANKENKISETKTKPDIIVNKSEFQSNESNNFNSNQSINKAKTEVNINKIISSQKVGKDFENMTNNELKILDNKRKIINEKEFNKKEDGSKSVIKVNNITIILHKSSNHNNNNINDIQKVDSEDNKLKSAKLSDEDLSSTNQLLSTSTQNNQLLTTQQIPEMESEVDTTISEQIESSETQVISDSSVKRTKAKRKLKPVTVSVFVSEITITEDYEQKSVERSGAEREMQEIQESQQSDDYDENADKLKKLQAIDGGMESDSEDFVSKQRSRGRKSRKEQLDDDDDRPDPDFKEAMKIMDD